LGGFTLLELRLKTGRTHQIRVHCAAIQRPVVGDPVYGRSKPPAAAADRRPLPARAQRQMLHAWRLEIDHPRTGERMRFESPMPEDMQRLIAQLEARGGKLEGGKIGTL
jgi:23S rRNA pseudouridine1911/1915/1917 synthase